MGDLPSPPPPFRWTRVWLSCNRGTAPMGNPQRKCGYGSDHSRTTPRAPLDASGGCLVTGAQRLRAPGGSAATVRTSSKASYPHARKNGRRANLGEENIPGVW